MNQGIVHNMLKAAAMIYAGDRLTTELIERRFEVSKATAKQYMVELERHLPVVVEQQGRFKAIRIRKE